MTAREKLAMEHPEKIDPAVAGGCIGCPFIYGYLSEPDYCDDITTSKDERCTKCWDRKIPEEKKTVTDLDGTTYTQDSDKQGWTGKDDSQSFEDILGFNFPCDKEWRRFAIDKFKAGEVTFNQLRERFGIPVLKEEEWDSFKKNLGIKSPFEQEVSIEELREVFKEVMNRRFGVNSTHMTREQFERLLDELDGQSLETLKTKNARYSSDDDVLHNFNAGAEIMGVTPPQCAWGYATKHLVALRDKILKDDFSDRDDLLEKCQDIINYIRFIWCLANQGKD